MNFSPLKYTWYNRVDGAFLGFRSQVFIPHHLEYSVTLNAGYSFMTQKPRYGVVFTRNSSEKFPFTFAVDYQDETATNDFYTTVSRFENTLGGLLTGRDFWDYFGMRSGGATISFDKFERLKLRTQVQIRSYQQLFQNTSWSLSGKDNFRPNPEIIPGIETYFSGGISWDSRKNTFYPGNAWFITLMGEKGSHDFSYSGILFQAKRYQMTFGMQRFVTRVLIRTRQGTHAEQHLFDLGGPGSLRGFAVKEFTGNRIFMANVDYFFGGTVLKRLPFDRIPLYNGLNLVLFTDIGSASIVDDSVFLLKDIFRNSHPSLFSNVGLGVSFAQDILRFDCARRLDRKISAWVVSLRINQRL
ncbi:MAG: hypothetical protein M1426_01825 [Patescibacteria group bacterium]|nr:hypothetical protein [Patescibacteria group bacterium]